LRNEGFDHHVHRLIGLIVLWIGLFELSA